MYCNTKPLDTEDAKKKRDMTAGQAGDTVNTKERRALIDKSRDKDSPNPGSYHIKDFIEESRLNPVKITYSFKGSGRKYPVGVVRKGDFLLPGAYSLTNFVQQAEKRQASYGFKNSPRPNNFTLGIRDKDIDISPCHYNVTEKPVVKLPCNHVMFRSAVQRLTFIPPTHADAATHQDKTPIKKRRDQHQVSIMSQSSQASMLSLPVSGQQCPVWSPLAQKLLALVHMNPYGRRHGS